jgi:predicted cupin superfamily sugar epimerase
MEEHELIEHPEGGRFKQVYRSEVSVSEGTRNRRALTHIYFSLNEGEVSRFHKVESDEIWNLYEGAGLVLYLWDEDREELERIELSRVNREYCHGIRSGLWQAAVPIGGPVLVGCSVAPGFEYTDFTIMEPCDEKALRLRQLHPDLGELIEPHVQNWNILDKKSQEL